MVNELSYLDDSFTYGKAKENHDPQLLKVMQRVKLANLVAHKNKYENFNTEHEYVDFMVWWSCTNVPKLVVQSEHKI